MLTGIGLRNFKAFGDEMQEAPLSKITLIYGPNSGGKSSIIQALLLLKQSLKPRYGKFRPLESKGEFVDLGSPQSMLHKHDTERELGIGVKYRNLELADNTAENDVRMTFLFEKEDLYLFSEDCIRLVTATYEITSNENDLMLLKAEVWPGHFHHVEVLGVGGEKISYPINREFLPTLAFPELETLRERLREPELDPILERPLEWLVDRSLERERRVRVLEQEQLERALEHEQREQGLLQGFVLERAMARAPERVLENRLDFEGMKLSQEQIIALTPENIPYDYERHLRLVNYLGPLRSAPQRIYTRSSATDSTTGIQGEYSASVLVRDPDGIETDVNRWFRQFEILYDIHARKLDEASFAGEFIIIELMPLDKEGVIVDEDFAVTLADVGYGINQILPVIIEGIASQEGSILCVEQPEIHLHPRLQANIADLMIDTIADEDGKRKQWIVETHSELLITRIQRRIREGKIKVEDVSVLYVDPDAEYTEGSAIIPLRMDENGDFIDHWPHGFFDEAFNELMAEPEDAASHPSSSIKDNGVSASIQSEELLDD